jgi:RNA-directed DNA polymerase
MRKLFRRVVLHYVLNLWVHQWRRRHAHGRVTIVRYADDFVMGFEKEAEARRMLVDLKERLVKFGLRLDEGKTRPIEFGRFAASTPTQVRRRPKHSSSSASPTTAGGPGTAGSS